MGDGAKRVRVIDLKYRIQSTKIQSKGSIDKKRIFQIVHIGYEKIEITEILCYALYMKATTHTYDDAHILQMNIGM